MTQTANTTALICNATQQTKRNTTVVYCCVNVVQTGVMLVTGRISDEYPARVKTEQLELLQSRVSMGSSGHGPRPVLSLAH